MKEVKDSLLALEEEALSALMGGQIVKSEPSEAAKQEVVRVVGFVPTERMEMMQEIAITCEDQGLGYLRDWIKSSRTHDFFQKESFSAKEWNEWVEIQGFNGWFYGGFPLPRTMSKEDIEGLDALFWDKMRVMMRDGDTKVMDLYAKITGKTDRAAEEAEGNTEIVEWLQVNSGSAGWKAMRKLK
tara:strand:- start:2457 stop:3011 length:555 start_codon:yes stop_codon:yes gene_type:complete